MAYRTSITKGNDKTLQLVRQSFRDGGNIAVGALVGAGAIIYGGAVIGGTALAQQGAAYLYLIGMERCRKRNFKEIIQTRY